MGMAKIASKNTQFVSLIGYATRDLSTLKPVFHWIQQICLAYNLLSYLKLLIWQFLCP